MPCRPPVVSTVCLLSFIACRSNVSEDASFTLDDPVTTIAPPSASGDDGDVHWDLRLNRMQCAHAGHPSTWCTDADRPAAIQLRDDKVVFTGAGNFSKASLTGKNTEQFYVTTSPALVQAYVSGWNELKAWALPRDAFQEAEHDGVPVTDDD